MQGTGWLQLLSMVLTVGLAALSTASAQQANTSTVFPSLADALASQALNVSRYSLFVELQGLQTTFQDPTQQLIVLAPVDLAYANFLQDYPFAQDLFKAGRAFDALTSTLLYVLPATTPQAQLQLSNSTPTTLATLQSIAPTAMPNSLSNLTFVPTKDPQVYYVGGLQGGAMVNISRSWIAGKSRIYLLDHLLVIPSTNNIPSAVMPGLTIASSIDAIDSQVLGSLSSLLAADKELTALLSDPDQVVTLLAPTNTALQTYLTSLGVFNLEAFKGTAAAAILLRSHVIPGRPWISSALSNNTRTIVPLWGSTHTVSLTLGPPSGNRDFTMGVQGSGNLQPVIVATPDLAAGKSCMHIVNGVILTGQQLPPLPPSAIMPLPDVLQGPLPTPSAAPTNDSSHSSSSVHPGVLAGIILGSVFFAVAVMVGLGLLLVRCKHFTHKSDRMSLVQKFHRGGSFWGTPWSFFSKGNGAGDESPTDGGCMPGGNNTTPAGAVVLTVPVFQADMPSPDAIAAPPRQIPGLIYGDPFIASTAPQYSWTDRVHDDTCVGVEANINDQQLDKLAMGDGIEPPVVRLSRTDVMQQIRLMKDGLLGQGASAFVFKGIWPTRFGSNAVLAIKLLKNPYEADPTVYEGICYEAAVLSTVRHPNVLRLYGYCLELPTACLIMELLPSSLKDRLYNWRETETADEDTQLTAMYTNTQKDTGMPQPPVDPLASTAAFSPHVTGFTVVEEGVSHCNAYVTRTSKHLTSTEFDTGAWNVSRVGQTRGRATRGSVEGMAGYSTDLLSGGRVPRTPMDVATTAQENSPLKQVLFRTQPLDTMMEEEAPTCRLLDKVVTQDSSTPPRAGSPANRGSPASRAGSPAGDGPTSHRIPDESEAATRPCVSATSQFVSAQGKFSDAGSKFSSATDAGAKMSVKPVINAPAPASIFTTRTLDVTDTTLAAAAPVVKTQGSNSPVLWRGSVEIEDLDQSPSHNTDATLGLGIVGQVPTPRVRDIAVGSSSANHSAKTKSTFTVTVTNNSSLGRMSVHEVLTVAADVAAGLAYLHKRPAVSSLLQHPQLMLSEDPPSAPAGQGAGSLAQGPESAKDEDGNMSIARIVHRDLKPSNILINSRGRAKISDFGLARWHSSSIVYTHHLGVGTLRYMAPELLLGHYTQPNAHTITNRVDIYSLGMLMYEMLTGRLPWNDLSDVQIVGAVISGARPPLGPSFNGDGASSSRDVAHKPASFETMPQMRALVTRCWHEKDMQRPTASEVHSIITTMLNAYP